MHHIMAGGAGLTTSQGGRMRGSNQADVRAQNERAVLTLIRRHGELAKADIARRTGLSAQTASVIMRVLEAEKLVLRDEPRRGRVGQPSVPMRLNPNGAFSLGLKIGRRSVELVLMDFVGAIRAGERQTYAYPELDAVLDFLAAAEARVVAAIEPKLRTRIVGLGVAMPFELWSWADEIGAPAAIMDAWRTADVVRTLSDATGFPVHLANDATAACAAENVFGDTHSSDYLYVFVGTFVGGGIVIDGDVVFGRTGNAAALGPMPVPRAKMAGSDSAGFDQLINAASIHVLEKMIAEDGGDPLEIWRSDAAWDRIGDSLDRWLAIAGEGLAHALVAASSLYDFECAVIDGGFPPAVRTRLVEATDQAMMRLKRQGLTPLEIRPGTFGSIARAMGGAALALFARYPLDHRVLYAEGE